MESTAALELPPVTPAFAPILPGTGQAETARAVATAERLIAQHRYDDAVFALAGVHVPSVSAPDLGLRVLFAEGWARLHRGELDLADSILERARGLSESRGFRDVDRADALFRLGACRFTRGKISNAISLFTAAIALAESSVEGDRVSAAALEWRARCYLRQREWEAAQADAERSLELAEAVGDVRLIALATMQCSVIAERGGDPRLALYYAERALETAAAIGDARTEARLLNNIGGLQFLLDRPEIAVGHLTKSFGMFLEMGNATDAAQVVSSLSHVHLRCGAPMLAEEQARHALSILDDRDDYVEERGNVHLVLGRALLEQSRPEDAMKQFAQAEWLFESLGSASHTAAAWMAQGDLFGRQGDLEASLALYRRAAEALQDVNF